MSAVDMKPPGPIALAAIADAEKNVGVTEQGGNNRGAAILVYQKAAGCRAGDPWCQAEVFYRLWKAAGKPGDYKLPLGFPRSGSTMQAAQWAKDHNLWIPVEHARVHPDLVKRGDLGFFYMWHAKERRYRIAHVGQVAEVHSWGVKSCEGNTGPEVGAHVERDGDGIYLKTRQWNEFGPHGGFARLPF
jgi:hypothetical protein